MDLSLRRTVEDTIVQYSAQPDDLVKELEALGLAPADILWADVLEMLPENVVPHLYKFIGQKIGEIAQVTNRFLKLLEKMLTPLDGLLEHSLIEIGRSRECAEELFGMMETYISLKAEAGLVLGGLTISAPARYLPRILDGLASANNDARLAATIALSSAADQLEPNQELQFTVKFRSYLCSGQGSLSRSAPVRNQANTLKG